jgi:ElaB/YqjD/DUF883 family membrane-anchored ribosome-binding protein
MRGKQPFPDRNFWNFTHVAHGASGKVRLRAEKALEDGPDHFTKRQSGAVARSRHAMGAGL